MVLAAAARPPGAPRRLPRAVERRPADPARAQHVRHRSATIRSRTPSSSPITARCARPVEGTVARDRYEDDPEIATGLLPDKSGYVMAMPQTFVQRAGGMEKLARPRAGALQHLLRALPRPNGRRQGHGRLQARQGHGPLPVARLRRRCPRTQDPRLRQMPDGQLFATITHGVRTMPAYGASDSDRGSLGHRRLRPRARSSARWPGPRPNGAEEVSTTTEQRAQLGARLSHSREVAVGGGLEDRGRHRRRRASAVAAYGFKRRPRAVRRSRTSSGSSCR